MFGKKKKSAAEAERDRAEEAMAYDPATIGAPEFKAMTARVTVDALPRGRVSVRQVFPERTITLTLGPEEAMDLAFQIIGAAAGRLSA